MLIRVKMNVFTLQKHYFYIAKAMLLVSILNLFSLPTMSFPYKSLNFSSKTFHFKSENEQNYTSPHSNLLSTSHNLEYKITLIHFINKSFTSLKTK